MTAVSGQSARQSASIDYMHAVLSTPSQWCSQHPLTKCEQCSALTVSGAVSGHCSEPVSAAKTGAVAVKSQLQCCSLVTYLWVLTARVLQRSSRSPSSSSGAAVGTGLSPLALAVLKSSSLSSRKVEKLSRNAS